MEGEKKEERQNRFRQEGKEEREERTEGPEERIAWAPGISPLTSSTLCSLDSEQRISALLAFGSQSKTIKTTNHRKELRSRIIKRDGKTPECFFAV